MAEELCMLEGYRAEDDYRYRDSRTVEYALTMVWLSDFVLVGHAKLDNGMEIIKVCNLGHKSKGRSNNEDAVIAKKLVTEAIREDIQAILVEVDLEEKFRNDKQ